MIDPIRSDPIRNIPKQTPPRTRPDSTPATFYNHSWYPVTRPAWERIVVRKRALVISWLLRYLERAAVAVCFGVRLNAVLLT